MRARWHPASNRFVGSTQAQWALHAARERTFGGPVRLQLAPAAGALLLLGGRPGRKEAPLRAVLCQGTFPTCPFPPLNEEEGAAAAAGWRFPLAKEPRALLLPRGGPLLPPPKWAMERFLVPVPGPTPKKAPAPRAPEEEADSAQQGSPKEAAKHEMPPLPWKRIRAEGLSCDYAPLYGRAQADEIFQQLEEEVEYFEGEFTKLHIFGKWHNIPRKQVTYGDAGLTYTYSGVTFAPKPWTPVLNRIRDRVQLVTGHTFNFVLINRYKDGHDRMGEHRDDERELVPRSPIASVSFGARRDFIFRHGASRGKSASQRISPVKLQLDHGSLMMMNFPTNRYWYHSLPSRKNVLAPRINLTFRQVRIL